MNEISYVITANTLVKQISSGHVDITNISNCYNQDLILQVLYSTYFMFTSY